MRIVPFGNLVVAIAFGVLTWRRRSRFSSEPFMHWFFYLPLLALGLHQFEEYAWPGGFHAYFFQLTGLAKAPDRMPSRLQLELLNLVGLLPAIGVAGWLGARRAAWAGLAVVSAFFGNGYFHFVYTLTTLSYCPGVITGTFLFLPLCVLAFHDAVRRASVGRWQLLGSFALGTTVSIVPFLHARLLVSLAG